MRAAALLAGLLLALSTGCATYTGGAKPIEQERVKARDGWIAAAPTPTVRQRNLTDCGAAVLAMVAARWQRPLTLEDAARALPPPGKKGVKLGALRDAARAHGLSAFAVDGDKAMLAYELDAGRPVIVGLYRPTSRTKALSHYEVVVALRDPASLPPGTEPEVVTIDPGSGWQVRRWSEFEAEWKPGGRPSLVVLGTKE